jgi:hypothetical protein
MPQIDERFTITWQPVGAGVLVTVPEIGASAMAESLDIRAIEETGQRLIDEAMSRRPAKSRTRASSAKTPGHPVAS